MNPIPFGPFELQTRIGHGGMGDVWRGIHIAQQVPVAIKVITREHAREERYLAGFRSEVRAIAALDHPGIVKVFEYGEIPLDAAVRSEGIFIAGSPYLVMEYASLGSLSKLPNTLGWGDMKAILLFLLDVLGHSHARGVIHRDLKPANVLFSGPEDIRPGPKLTDFGIAYALEATTHSYLAKGSLGSPPYMAPEQWFGDWRDYGPWTDLYALGCIAYQLASGTPPFLADDSQQIAAAHMSLPPPPLPESAAVPPGFESWLCRLLQKEPVDRFQRAADAATVLKSLGDPASTALGQPPHRSARKGTSSGPDTAVVPTVPIGDPNRVDRAARGPTRPLQPAGRAHPPWVSQAPLAHRVKPCPVPPPEVPDTWNKKAPPDPSIRLVGTGLGLFGLRVIPLVDRASELDLLWKMLLEAHQLGLPRLVALRGPSGYGKSRLVRWTSERAHEMGAATVLKAVHSPIVGPGSGLPRMIAGHMRCVGLSRNEILSRTQRFLRSLGVVDPYEWNALTELIAPANTQDAADQESAVRFTSARQRYTVIRRFVQLLSRERPVLLWLDDVQWGLDALQFAEYLVKQPSSQPLPVLLLLTAGDEALSSRPAESALLTSLMRRKHTRQLNVGPLEPSFRSELVRNLLFLEGQLAEQVETRSGGNPLFAIQLVGDWIRRGVLQVGPAGFELKPGEKAELPDNIHTMWATVIERVLHEFATSKAPASLRIMTAGPEGPSKEAPDTKQIESTQIALELAAVLGQQVDSFEWQQACRAIGIDLPSRFPDFLFQSRIAYPTESGISLAHNMLRESLERLARENRRWARLNQACATMLQHCYADRPKGISERIGLHLYQAQDYANAIEPLLRAAHERIRQTDFQQALYLLERYETSLDRIHAGTEDIRRAEGWLLKARILIHQTDFNSARKWAEQAAETARRAGSKKLLAEALRRVAMTNLWRGQLPAALELFERALSLHRQCQDKQGLARTLFHYGNAVLPKGELKRAESCFQEALDLSAHVGDWETWVDCLRKLALVALKREELDRATALTQQALEHYTREGNRYGIAGCWNSLGNIHLSRHQLDLAEQSYRKVLQLLESVGVTGEMLGVQLNLCLILLETGQYREARKELEIIAKSCVERGVRGFLAATHCLFCAAAAGDQDWIAMDRHLQKADELLAETGLVESDAAWPLQLAGDLALQARHYGRAQKAYQMVLEMWQKLENAEKVAEVRAAIAQCVQVDPDKGGAPTTE